MAVSRRLRFEILRRDNYTCRYCGASAPDVKLTVDHVKPVALGGTDDPSNLVTACEPCNGGKTSISPDSPVVADVEADALRWARAIQEVVRTASLERQFIADQVARFDEAWSGWTYKDADGRHPVPRAANWPDSIERFLAVGLDIDTLTHFIGVALRRPNVAMAERWTYFCGCCWRELDKIQEQASRVLAFEDQWKRDLGRS